MTFVRTVLGDLDPADLGPTYAHEHLVIDGGRPVELEPDFDLGDVERALEELAPARELGLGAVVDAMPCSAGRNVRKLAEISRRSGIHVVAPTGLHLAKYYYPELWSEREPAEALAERFRLDVEIGIDANDYLGSVVERTEHRAGIIKVAGSGPEPTDRDRRLHEAAALAHAATGCPILVHCTAGQGALQQLDLLEGHGVDLRHVTLSHTDKVVDRGYHREILVRGVFSELDHAFRWKLGEPNGTLILLEWLLADGFGDQLMLGMDAARQRYWRSYGGEPGLAFLLGPFSAAMRERGIGDEAQAGLFVRNPARAFAFRTTEGGTR